MNCSKKIDQNDKIAEEIYRLFYDNILYKNDHTPASKDALLRSLEARIENTKSLTELAKAVARKESGKNVGVGVAISTSGGSNFGIDLNQINSEL